MDTVVFAPALSALVIFLTSFVLKDVELKARTSWLISLVGALITFTGVLLDQRRGVVSSALMGNWMSLGGFEVGLSYYLDAWSVGIATVASLLTSLVIVFSRYYIGEHDHSSVYYGMVSVFLFGMELLVLSNNLLFTFLGWELVGICSWFLIGFYHFRGGEEGERAIRAGRKALLMTSLADVGFLFSLPVLPSLEVSSLSSGGVPTHVLLAMVIAAAGKSAQFPRHIWIAGSERENIDAMQGPTTVSALIHAATMVNAGVFLVARVTHFGGGTGEVVLWLGLITVVYAGLMACFSEDIKRVLAYSTISQLGLMFTALGVGETGEFTALWHLVNHAFYKALLFLIAGFLIHRHGTRKLSELQEEEIPLAVKTSLVIGLLSLSGLPPFSGFFSKEHIIELVLERGDPTMTSLGYLAALVTGVYAFRLLKVLVLDTKSGGHTPRTVLLVTTLLSGIVLSSSFSYFYVLSFVWPHAPSFSMMLDWGILAVSFLGVFLGLLSPTWMPKLPEVMKDSLREGLYLDRLATWASSVTLRLVSYVASRIQTGVNYWNFTMVTLSTLVVGAAYYYIQSGGVF